MTYTKSVLSAGVCNKKKSIGEGIDQQAHRIMLFMNMQHCFRAWEKLVTQCSQSSSIKRRWTHTNICWNINLYLHKDQGLQMLNKTNTKQRHDFCWDFTQFVQQYSATSECLWFRDEAHLQLGEFVNKQNTKFWPCENLSSKVQTACKWTMWCKSASKELKDWSSDKGNCSYNPVPLETGCSKLLMQAVMSNHPPQLFGT